MNSINKSLITSIAVLGLSACSNFQSSTPPAEFNFQGKLATHIATEAIGDSYTFITPKGAVLEDHFTLGNRFHSFTEPGDRKRILTYITETTNGTFKFTKTKCKKERKNPYLLEGQYFDKKTNCLMDQESSDIPIFGIVTEYEGTHKVTQGRNSDTHTINITKAKSTHTTSDGVLGFIGGPVAMYADEPASTTDLDQLFQRYTDDTITLKFEQYSPDEIKSAVLRESRRLTKGEKLYVDYVDSLSMGDTLYLSHAITLRNYDPKNGIVAFRMAIERYKNNGSILNITPIYYPSKSEVGTSNNKTINYVEKRNIITSMLKKIQAN